jgi:outer membrane protein assembly factor BamE (lipoprotein component of BamABCDE complex)
MKAKSKILLFAIVLFAIAAFLSSCSKKTCPAYSKVVVSQQADLRG